MKKYLNDQSRYVAVLLGLLAAIAFILLQILPVHAFYTNENFAISTVGGGGIGTSDLSIVITPPSNNSQFPQTGTFIAVLWHNDSHYYNAPSSDPAREIVLATLSSGNTYTIQRARGRTVAGVWPAGSHIANVQTKETLDDIEAGSYIACGTSSGQAVCYDGSGNVVLGGTAGVATIPSNCVYTPVNAGDLWRCGSALHFSPNGSSVIDLAAFTSCTGSFCGVTAGTGVVAAVGNNVNASGGFLIYGNAAVAASVLTGYTSGPGTVAGTDTIIQGIQKLNGNLEFAANTATLATASISSGACATAVTVTASGVATTDVIDWGFNGDPTGVTGYMPSSSGMLTIIAYPTAGNVNFKVCNNTASSITPGSALTLNFRVRR